MPNIPRVELATSLPDKDRESYFRLLAEAEMAESRRRVEAARLMRAAIGLLKLEAFFGSFWAPVEIELVLSGYVSAPFDAIGRKFDSAGRLTKLRNRSALSMLKTVSDALPGPPPQEFIPKDWVYKRSVICRREDPCAEIGPLLLGRERYELWLAEREAAQIAAAAGLAAPSGKRGIKAL